MESRVSLRFSLLSSLWTSAMPADSARTTSEVTHRQQLQPVYAALTYRSDC